MPYQWYTNNSFTGGGTTDYGFIGGGHQNCIETNTLLPTHYATIAGGCNNIICEGAGAAVIAGGIFNCANGAGSFIGGGGLNVVNACATVIGGGGQNQVYHANSCFGFIGGGQGNTISSPLLGSLFSCYSTIAGGWDNHIQAGTAVGSESCFGFIGGGESNVVGAGTCYSSIIGGQGNSVVHNWATVAGWNVTSGADCAFTTNCVIACNTPVYGLGPAPGTLQYFPVTPGLIAAGIPVGACLVFIQ
ncbi:MAG: hypothetical protein V4649_08810 [Bacteroidota bacterium]